MNVRALKDLDKDEILSMLGLQSKETTSDWVVNSLGPFGVGLLIGAGLALLLAPKAGSELREDLREKLGKLGSAVEDKASQAASQYRAPGAGVAGH